LQFNLKLEEALAVNNITKALNLLAPRYRSYWMMKEDLAFFLSLQDELWPAITCDTVINPGQSNQVAPPDQGKAYEAEIQNDRHFFRGL
jgi:hypothetical protein